MPNRYIENVSHGTNQCLKNEKPVGPTIGIKIVADGPEEEQPKPRKLIEPSLLNSAGSAVAEGYISADRSNFVVGRSRLKGLRLRWTPGNVANG